jgi:hypothetical protein
MNYKTEKERLELEPLTAFLREAGTKAEPQPSYRTTKAGLPSELTAIVLDPRG